MLRFVNGYMGAFNLRCNQSAIEASNDEGDFAADRRAFAKAGIVSEVIAWMADIQTSRSIDERISSQQFISRKESNHG